MPHDVLTLDFYVPESSYCADQERFKGKAIFQEILKVTPEVTLAWIRRVSKDSSTKAKARGETINEYVETHQDRTKNALAKSVEAAFQAWCEELRADESQFMAERITAEKESVKNRAKLVRQLEECHDRAWQTVAKFMEESMMLFAGKTSDADSTLLPVSRSWVRNSVQAMGTGSDDVGVVLWLNLPAVGILCAERREFFLTYIANVLADWPRNSVAFVVMPNRAGQDGRTLGLSASQNNEMCDGNQNASIVCGTLSLDSSGKEIMARLSNEIYNACRAGKLNLSGFPAFDPLVQALKSNGAQEAPKAFRVSSQVGDKLLVLESLAQKWVSNEGTAERAQQMIRDHNSEYNPEGEYWSTTAEPEEPPAKRAKLESLTQAEISKEAREVMQEGDGQWFSFNLKASSLVLLEGKNLPSHLTKLNNVNHPVELKALMTDLEDLGE
ncbi:Uncharacterized protein SCF082_LOCUS34511, partial [Durusdinium trenchii]